MTALVVDGVDVAYGRTQVLFDVSLAVPEGSLVCLMGRNGVGKTTLLNTISGLLSPSRGTVTFGERDITSVSPYKRARSGIGYVPQGHAVFPQLTTKENLTVVNERVGKPSQSAYNFVLELFPALAMMLGRPAGLLSGGQAKQLAIARALITEPDILILDEPTEGIQPSIIHQIEDTIATIHRETGMTMLLVEQYVEFALRLADTYAVMDGGRMVRSGSAADVDVAAFAELIAI